MSNSIDISGMHQKNGKLLAIKIVGKRNRQNLWSCKCDCGNYTEVTASRFNLEQIKSCGCLATETKSKNRRKNIEGIHQKNGKLTAIKSTTKSKHGSMKWLCKCDCGNYTEVTTNAFTSEQTKSCGCLKSSVSKGKIKKNLIGKKYSKLTVVELVEIHKTRGSIWKCVCDCGNFTNVGIGNLQSGHVKSCGCLISEKDITGQKFNKLTAIESTKRKNKNNEYIWVFKCNCGNIIERTKNTVMYGGTKSCGCLHKETACILGKNKKLNLINSRFGKLIVLKEIKKEEKKIYWLCKCDCGNLNIVSTASLRSGHVRSCGCLSSEMCKIPFTNKKEQAKINKLKADLCSQLGMTWEEASKKINNVLSKTLKELL